MVMAVPEVLAGLATTGSAAAGSAAAGGAAAIGGGAAAATGGLSGGQKLGAFGSALPKPKTQHPYIVGLALIAIGGFALVGSVTGTLPSMLAALFVPEALVDSSNNTVTRLSKIAIPDNGGAGGSGIPKDFIPKQLSPGDIPLGPGDIPMPIPIEGL